MLRKAAVTRNRDSAAAFGCEADAQEGMVLDAQGGRFRPKTVIQPRLSRSSLDRGLLRSDV